MPNTQVMVVDDSVLVRKILTRELNKAPGLEVIDTAPDPYVARDKIVELSPDVITLDIEMPKMDGITFLKKIMEHHPLPVVIVSSLSQEGSKVALKAIELGAVEVVGKPTSNITSGLQSMGQQLADKVKAAARVNISQYQNKTGVQSTAKKVGKDILADVKASDTIIAIGSSTGGVKTLKQVIPKLPASTPGTVIVQHMPGGFTTSFSNRLDEMSGLEVKEAADGDRVRPGRVLFAPGNYHMLLRRRGAQYKVKVKQGPRVHHQRPSADVLFKSVAKEAGVNAIGVILTGMGEDGADGLLKMKQAGAKTIGQDAETSVVYGMPKIAKEKGAVETVSSLDKIPDLIVSRVKELSAD